VYGLGGGGGYELISWGSAEADGGKCSDGAQSKYRDYVKIKPHIPIICKRCGRRISL
jgi:hypothetical protein